MPIAKLCVSREELVPCLHLAVSGGAGNQCVKHTAVDYCGSVLSQGFNGITYDYYNLSQKKIWGPFFKTTFHNTLLMFCQSLIIISRY